MSHTARGLASMWIVLVAIDLLVSARFRAVDALHQSGLHAPADPPAGAVAIQRGGGGVRAARTGHAAARMRRRAGQEQPVDRGGGPAEAGYRPEDQLLVQLRGAAVDRAGDQVRVAPFEVVG